MKELFVKNKKSISMFLILIVIFLVFGVLSGFINLTARNVTNIIIQNAYVIILAIGMTLVVITGNIDMSVGSVCGFTGALAAILYNTGIGLIPTILITVICGLFIGSIIGFFTAYKAVPAFIVTLAGMQVFRGLTYAITNMSPIGFYDDKFGSISAGFIQDYIPGEGNLSVIVIMLAIFIAYVVIDKKGLKKKAEKGIPVESSSYHRNKYIAILIADLMLTWVFYTYRGIPNVFVIIAILALIMTYVLNNTVFGRHVYAIGGNKEAAELSGIDAKKTLFKVYIIMGAFAALAGIVFASYMNQALPVAGNMFELDAIASTYIGGASAAGGIGTVAGSVIGGFILGVINNGMSILNLGAQWQYVVKGLVLLSAVLYDLKMNKKAR